MASSQQIRQIVLNADGTAVMEHITRTPATVDLDNFLEKRKRNNTLAITPMLASLGVGNLHLAFLEGKNTFPYAVLHVSRVNFHCAWSLSPDGKLMGPAFSVSKAQKAKNDGAYARLNPAATDEKLLWTIPSGMNFWIGINMDARDPRAISFCWLDRDALNAEKGKPAGLVRPPFPNIFPEQRLCWTPRTANTAPNRLGIIERAKSLVEDWVHSEWNDHLLTSQVERYLVWHADGTQVVTDMERDAPMPLDPAASIPGEWVGLHKAVYQHVTGKEVA